MANNFIFPPNFGLLGLFFAVNVPNQRIMTNKELRKQIDDLILIISLEEENYKTALQTQMPYETLKQMRLNIKKLKGDLQVLIDQDSVQNTGDLPDGGVE